MYVIGVALRVVYGDTFQATIAIVGYTDPSTLTRSFLRWTKLTPKGVAGAVAQTTKDQEELAYVWHQITTSHSFTPKTGMVPNASTATSIAYAVGVPIYGKKNMDGEQPFRAALKDGVWTVLGTLHCSSCVGGTLIVQIEKATGKIVYINHSE